MATRKRGNGEGSIRQRRDGCWEGRVRLGGRRMSVYGRTRAEAARNRAGGDERCDWYEWYETLGLSVRDTSGMSATTGV